MVSGIWANLKRKAAGFTPRIGGEAAFSLGYWRPPEGRREETAFT